MIRKTALERISGERKAEAFKSESGCALVRKLCGLGPSEPKPRGRDLGRGGMGEREGEVAELALQDSWAEGESQKARWRH